jgi:hypothetical protein
MMQMVMAECKGGSLCTRPTSLRREVSYMKTGQEIGNIFIGAAHAALRHCCKRHEMMRMPFRCRQVASLSSGTDTA